MREERRHAGAGQGAQALPTFAVAGASFSELRRQVEAGMKGAELSRPQPSWPEQIRARP